MESARIGEHRARPSHETVNAAHAPEHLLTGTQQEVVSIRENDLRPGVFERLGQLRLHGGLRSHRHEYRGMDGIMKRVKRRGTSARAVGDGIKMEFQAGCCHLGRYPSIR